MDNLLASSVFESLASGIRLDVFRLLVKTGPQGLVAGEIANQLQLPPTNLSFHLKALTHSGLLGVTQEGRFQRYRANMPLMMDLIHYLTAECCSGHPEACLAPTDVCCDANAFNSAHPTDLPASAVVLNQE